MHVFTQMHIGLIPFLRVELGLDTLAVGFMVSIPLLVQGVTAIPGGLLADRIDRSRLIAIGLLVSGFGGLMMVWVNNVSQLIVFVSFFSITMSLVHPPALSAVSDLVSPSFRGKALGLFGSAGTLGIALGPITSSLLVNNIGWRWVYLLWSIPSLLMPALIFRLKLEETKKGDERQTNTGRLSMEFGIFRNLSLILVLMLMGFRAMGGNAINTYITPYFVDQLNIEAALAVFIFGLRPLMGVFASSLGGVMADKIGERRWLALGFICQIVALLVAASSGRSFSFVIAGYLLYSFFGLMEMPAEQSIITKITPAHSRGLAFSLTFLPGTIAGSFSPVLVALLVDALGIWQIFPYAIAMFAMAILILGFLWKRI